MKRLFKTVFAAVTFTGMLSAGIPVFTFAEGFTEEIAFDPNELLTEDELPDDAEIREEERIEDVVFTEDPGDPGTPDGSDEPTDQDDHDGPLTPDGNMSLIDDYGDTQGKGKQFITLQTKSGAVFYLIIDRDDRGMETVHFLNKVDEADILAYMEDEDEKAYEERKAQLEEKKAALLAEEEALREQAERERTEEPDPTPVITVTPEGQAKQQDVRTKAPLLIVVGIAGVVTAAFFYLLVVKKKTPAKKNMEEPDPDDWEDIEENDRAETTDEKEDIDE